MKISMFASVLFAVFGSQSLCFGDIVEFSMYDRPDVFNGQHSHSLESVGITATFTANFGYWLRANGSTFGIDQNGDVFEAQLDQDGGGNKEIVTVSFNAPVRLRGITLSQFVLNDVASITVNGTETFFDGTQGSTFSFENPIKLGETFRVGFFSGNGFSFDSFEVEAIPEPSFSLILSGLAIYGLLRPRQRK